MTEKDKKPHEGSNGTDRNGPSGTDSIAPQRVPESEEEELKRRIEELRRRDPFIYR